jgi:hypothetical protein
MDRYVEKNPGIEVGRRYYSLIRQRIRTLLKDLSNGIVRISDIIRNLKKLARAEEAWFNETVDVNEAIGSSLRLVHNTIMRYGVDIKPSSGNGHGSQPNWRCVLRRRSRNLVGNADSGLSRSWFYSRPLMALTVCRPCA